MTMSRIALSILSLGLATLANGATPAAPTAPPSAALKASIALAKIYNPRPGTVDSQYSGLIYMTVNVKSGRTQNVYFAGLPGGPVDAPTQQIFSVAAILARPITAALATRLLRENFANSHFGVWSLNPQSDGRVVIYFIATFPANARSSTVHAVVTTVALNSDALELELSGADAL